jgi:mersacidin/lichenicidin family type 2 lantibiotic
MSPESIKRAWKDDEYRMSLSEAERAKLPVNPAGTVELSLRQLAQTAGGRQPLSTTNSCYSYRTKIQGCVCP